VRGGARAKVLARQGKHAEAEEVARGALRAVSKTDHLNTHADTLMDLAEVLALANRQHEAVPSVQEALRLYEQKGNIVSRNKARKLLAELTSPAI